MAVNPAEFSGWGGTCSTNAVTPVLLASGPLARPFVLDDYVL
jgi:hypothetical protein